jgi:hypothetical protein
MRFEKQSFLWGPNTLYVLDGGKDVPQDRLQEVLKIYVPDAVIEEKRAADGAPLVYFPNGTDQLTLTQIELALEDTVGVAA